MYLKLIACNVLLREFCGEIAVSSHTFDIEFTEKGDHEDSFRLRGILQAKITAAEDSGKAYDAILLGFGLCGNSTAGLVSKRIPLVLPRAHDCCTLFLGSKELFREHFKDNPSKPFSSTGYMERGESHMNTSEVYKALGLRQSLEEYTALYGEENARYIMETLSEARNVGQEEEILFIDIPQTSFLGYADLCRKEAEKSGKRFSLIPGSTGIIKALIGGDWNPTDFLVAAPGETVSPVYDWSEIIQAKRLIREKI